MNSGCACTILASLLATTAGSVPLSASRPGCVLQDSSRGTASPGALLLTGVGVDSGAVPFAGDTRRLTTISPNGDGFRDRARIHFTLGLAARVELVVTRTKPAARVVLRRSYEAPAGTQSVAWAPSGELPARTYRVRVRATGRGTSTACSDADVVVRVQGVDAAFARAGYGPGATARLTVSTDASSLSVQVFHVGGEAVTTHRNDQLEGTAVSPPRQLTARRANRMRRFDVEIGSDWPSGFYYAQLTAGDGRIGYAPLVVAPQTFGEHRTAVVLPTYTWQAYNFYDADGDGWGDTWYAGRRSRVASLGRPYLNRGVPFHFRSYDLPFLHWLGRNRIAVDVLTDRDVERAGSGDRLARAYDFIVFPGHHEYVTELEYSIVRRYRDLGGNLAWLSANNFFWKVIRHGSTLERVAQWRRLGRPEAALIGVQYRGNDEGTRKGAFEVAADATTQWLLRDTGLVPGASFGEYGIEIDSRTPASPPQTRVLATIPHLFGPRFTAEMTYYETPAGARVFAAGAFTLAGDAGRPAVGRLLANLFAEFGRP